MNFVPTPQSEWQTLVDMLRWQAKNRPNEPLFCLWDEHLSETPQLTFGELDRRARMVGAQLQARKLANERALLLFQPGLDFIVAFMGCLYAGVVAVPSYPLKRKRASERVQLIATDASTAIVLSDVAPPRWLSDELPSLARLPWLQIEQMSPATADAWQPPAIHSETLAFLQYTSGSTANPKGVMLTHKNLLHNLSMIFLLSNYRPGDRSVVWVPPYHDMGLIGGLLQAIYAGGYMMLMSPFTFLQKPFRWLHAMSRFGATHSTAPNFAFDILVDAISDEELNQLDLSRLQVIFNGAERVRQSTLDRFAARFGRVGFRRNVILPCYGLAESTLMATCHPPKEPHIHIGSFDSSVPFVDVVGSGRPFLGTKVAVVDPQSLTELPDSRIGEIWISGDSISKGYWNQPDLSRESFEARLTNKQEHYLRTGDLGFVRNGQLYVTGRIKELIVLNGRNYYPQDIELTIEAVSSAVQPYAGATFTIEENGRSHLTVVYELKRAQRHVDTQALFQTIRAAIAAEHGLDLQRAAFIRPGYMPKTSSGKVRRSKCRHLLLAGELPIINDHKRELPSETAVSESMLPPSPPQTKVGMLTLLQNKIGELLEVAPEKIAPTDELADLGISSLNVVKLKEYFETVVDAELPLELFFELETVDDLVNYLLQPEAEGNKL